MISQYFIGPLPSSLPDEFPTQRNLSAFFSDLNDLKRKVNIAVCFHFSVNDAAGKCIPFLFGWQPRFCVVRQVDVNDAVVQ